MPVQGITSDAWAQFLRLSAQARTRNPDFSPAATTAPRRGATDGRSPVPAVNAAAYTASPVEPGKSARPRILGNHFDAYA